MNTKDFPIVGIGASAGGLEAYKTLLRSLPADSGAAYILVQHLAPDHESLMADLLARQTKMKVLQAEHEMPLSPNTVYVIPPGKFIRLIDHGLFLDQPIQQNGVRLSIDYFFRSLAETRGERAIAILLSGTGTDGTLGIQEVKAAGGMAMVQQPDDAEYDGMPRSAIATGAVDFVVPAKAMGERLIQFLQHPYVRKDAAAAEEAAEVPPGFHEVLQLLRKQTDYDFRSYKKGTVERRIQRRMGLRQIKQFGKYVEFLRRNPEEVQQLFRDLLIGVTRFFREPEVWEAFGDTVVDSLIAKKPKGATIRAWVPGCASGEEAYTLAMVMYERIERQNGRVNLQIFATDLNDRAIEAARLGRYPSAISADVPERLLEKYFTEENDTYRINKRLRETVVFATQNVIADPPFSKLDVITCRNLMIYLEADVQNRMIEMFHFALEEDGHLLLGNSENAERPGRLFTTIDKTHRIYRRSSAARARTGSFPIVPGGKRKPVKQADAAASGHTTGVEQARRHLLERFVPASVLVDHSFEVQYFHGPVRDYLDFPAGEPTTQLPDMALPGIRTKLRAVLNAVAGGKRRAESVATRVPRNGHHVAVDIVAESIGDDEGDGRILVYFSDASEPRDPDAEQQARDDSREKATPEERDQVASLEYELQSTREDLQSTIEEMETANEELKASNEEVMSMNEELQSTNEELETSREEMQSLNEELSTVNSQLEDKIDEVEQSNNDLTNLLVSTDIGVIFLDTDLLIRRFTPAMTEIMRIIDGDIGRPVEDIATRAKDEALIEDARRALGKLTEIEAEVTTDNGRYLIRRVRPYRTSENRIEGVVVTYTDVTSVQLARKAARLREQQQEAVAALGRAALSSGPIEDVIDLAVTELSTRLDVRFVKVLQLDDDKRAFTMRGGVGWQDGLVGTAKVENGVKSQAGYTLERASPVVVPDFRDEKRFAASRLLKDHHILCGASVHIGPAEAPWGVLGAHESDLDRCGFDADDINFLQSVAHMLWLAISQERAVASVEHERTQLRELTDSLPIRFGVLDTEARYELVNKAYAFWGHAPDGIEGKHKSEVVGDEYFAQVAPYVRAVLSGEAQTFEVVSPQGDGQDPRTELISYVPRINDANEVTGFYSASIDITEQKRLESDLAERFEQYRTLGESIPFGVWLTDPDGKLRYISQSFLDLVGMGFDEIREFGWVRTLVQDTREETLKLWEQTCASGANWEKEHRIIGADGATHHVLSLGRPIRNDAGEITSWAGLNLDITARKEEEERLGVISAELDHRVKNILATVSTIVRMTGQSATSVEGYIQALEARIRAMGAAHKLLAKGHWRGMNLRDLIDTELAPYLSKHPGQIEIAGPDFLLGPSTVQPLALALHELITNAAKYGALQAEGGRLEIEWTAHGRLELSWRETGLTGLQPPSTTGFGTTLLTRVLAAHDIDVQLRFHEHGLCAKLTLEKD